MSVMTDIVRAGHIGVKDFRDHAPKYMRDNQVYLVLATAALQSSWSLTKKWQSLWISWMNFLILKP